MTSTSIRVTSLSKHFDAITAVDDISFDVNAGEMFGIVGPDGAGKTTLIRMLCGVLVPSTGTAEILGNDINTEPDKVKKEIGYLSQRFSLYGDLTIDENIEFFAEINGVYDYRSQREELLEFTRLTKFRDRLAEKLSGGMKQKLALACTLIHTPKIIFLDEPTTGVDPVSRRDFWRILQSLLNSGITIVMSTPYLDEAERCTRVALMNKGKIMQVNEPARMKQGMKGEVIEVVCERVREASRVLKTLPALTEVQTFGDRLHVIAERETGAVSIIRAALEQANIPVGGIRIISPSLENVFISLLTQNQIEEAEV